MTPTIAEWPARIDGARVAGSLYAVAPARRVEGARALVQGGHDVHADMIVSARGEHRGVTPDELRRVREAVPGARLEVHVILDRATEAARAALAEAVATALGAAADVIVLPRATFEEHPALIAAVRRRAEAWAEIAPRDEPGPPAGADGALVMLIEPGTVGAADDALLERIPALAALMPVGVDGGVTPPLAERSAAAGARTVVAGRSLFLPTTPREERS